MDSRPKLLVIDDDAAFLKAVEHAFESKFQLFTTERCLQGIELAQQEKPDLILLDLLLPDIDGVLACKLLKSKKETRDIPVIAITGVEDDERRSEALLSGADDLVSKPLRPKELLVRIQSRLHKKTRVAPAKHEILSCGNLRIDLDKLEVFVGTRSVKLTSVEVKLLSFFVRNKGSVITRETLLDNIWKETEVNDRVVDNRILALRKKLRGFNHQFVTHYGIGYSLREKKR